jgi:hypothetical protein
VKREAVNGREGEAVFFRILSYGDSLLGNNWSEGVSVRKMWESVGEVKVHWSTEKERVLGKKENQMKQKEEREKGRDNEQKGERKT